MTKIIAPLYQHDIISKQILNKNKIVLDTSLLPLNSFIDELIDHTDNHYDQQLIEILKKVSSKLTVLSSYVDNDMFIQSIKDFHISMYLYNIKLDDLNDESSKDKDLKIIFKALANVIPNEIEKYQKLKDVLQNVKLQDTYISKHHLKNNFEEMVVELLYDHGLKVYEDKDYTIASLKVYYANNMRSEVEASAQLIIDKQLVNAQVILLDDAYEPLVRQVYDRYHIQTNLAYVDPNNTYVLKMLSVFNLLINKDSKSMSAFLTSNPFNVEHIKELTILNDLFNFDYDSFMTYHFQELNDPILNKNDIAYYNSLNEKSQDTLRLLQELLQSLDDDYSLRLIENVFNYFQEFHYDQQLLSLKQSFINHKEVLLNTSNLFESLQSILQSSRSSLINSDHVVVVSLDQHHYFDKSDVIILGSTIKNYPNLNKLSGVIDERYVESLNYPKKTERFTQQLRILDEIKQGNNLYIFYPLSTNEGKGIEASFSLLNFAAEYNEEPQRYPLIENDYYKQREYLLDASLAQELFFEGGKLSGSISAFEQYNKCPYAYYLKYGMKLYPKSLPSLSYAYLGSVTHLIIERIVTSQIEGQSYPSDDEIITIINNAFASLDLLKDPQVDVVKLTLIQQLIPILNYLKKADADTNFKPIALEKKFNLDINDKISIYGIIDRVDQYNDYVRIIDYKSSNHSLSATELKKGLQLQLITYLMAMTAHEDLKPAGAFYISLKTENSATGAATIKKSKPHFIKNNNEEKYHNYLNSNRLQGWHFDIEDDFYFSKDYVMSLTQKDEIVSVSSPYNFETVAVIVEHVYQNIYDDLSAGLIDCKPVGNPCGFCEYQHICQTTSSDNYRAQIFKNQNLKKELETDVD